MIHRIFRVTPARVERKRSVGRNVGVVGPAAIGLVFGLACGDGAVERFVDAEVAPGSDAAAADADGVGDAVIGGDAGFTAAVDPVEFVGLAAAEFTQEAVQVGPIPARGGQGERVGVCSGLGAFALYEVVPADGVRLVRRINPEVLGAGRNRCQHFTAAGPFVVVAHRGDETIEQPFLAVVDPATGRTIAVHSPSDAPSFEGLTYHDGWLYAAAHEAGVSIFRVQADGQITPQGDLTGLSNAWRPLFNPSRSELYVADAQGGVAIYDAADPRRPVLKARIPTEGTVKDLAVGEGSSDGYLYAASGVAGVEVIDLTVPGGPAAVARIDTPGSALGITLDGTRLVVADWGPMLIFDLATAERPVLIGHQKAYGAAGEPDPTGRVLDVFAEGGRVFAAEWAGLQMHRLVADADAPDLVLPEPLAFSRTATGTEPTAGIFVSNFGRRLLTIDRILGTSTFVAEPQRFVVPESSQRLVTVTFRPQRPREVRATLTFFSDDPDEPQAQLLVVGNRAGLQPGDEVPNLRMFALDGQEIELASLRGQPILLAYFATF